MMAWKRKMEAHWHFLPVSEPWSQLLLLGYETAGFLNQSSPCVEKPLMSAPTDAFATGTAIASTLISY